MNDSNNGPAFRDFIPEGEDPGAFGNGRFQDFVPTPETKTQVIKELAKEEPIKKGKK